MSVPDKPSLDGLEAKWGERWEADGIYRFDRSKPRERIYAIDTPPPTASGSLHVGHVMSYTHTDLVARYKRMRGFEVFYPMGWDDNGLPTERRVQNYYGVRCDPSLAYDPSIDAARFEPRTAGEPLAISRPNFIELCSRLTAEDEKAFEDLFRRLGLSVDWTQTYTTIGDVARRVSQRAFLRLVRRGLAYSAEAPTMWDVDFHTAVAQAEIEDREVDGTYHRVAFDLEGEDGRIEVETSRPELIPACVAVVVHPSDERYAALVGRTALTPLFRVPVPIVAHELADPEKGTGAAQVCTFGDVTDVQWWRELGLPTRVVVRRDGTLAPVRFGVPGWESREPERANAAIDELAGLPAARARRRVAELLAQGGWLLGEPTPVRHVVKFFEKGDRPLEIITSRQWFVKTLEFREELLERGRELRWHPAFMGARYASWVEGLNQDWAISRQRYFGVPFPVWYPLDDAGAPRYDDPILPEESTLPIDPLDDVPPGYRADQRDVPGGFTGDPDVMDTWATSSLTPQIAARWEDDPDLFGRLFPMDLRPQAHEIIRTWLFYTVLRAHLEHGSLPWTDAAISGFVLDPERKKMSKSKGNVVTPIEMFERHSADAVRYWAASARLGYDAAFDEQQMRVGRRLAIKILNASRFVLSMQAPPGEVTEPVDLALLASLAGVVAQATDAFEDYEHARALDLTERFFWGFTDDYLELVKQRAYGVHGPQRAGSAVATLRSALDVLVRLFAPFLPYVTEEVWSWWRQGSVHRAAWPTPEELVVARGADPEVYEVAAEVLTAIRKQKALAKVSLRAPVLRVTVRDTPERLAKLADVEADVREAGTVERLETSPAPEPSVEVVLGEPAQA
ncbi:MAG: valine--tRNA ligase [Actinomycetota bacterium]|jgi:valyl-tRNA synthetase|nr:MAG: valine--tRNA ligase [Actinomycetota bacterium]